MDFSKEKIIHAYGFGGKVDEEKVRVAASRVQHIIAVFN